MNTRPLAILLLLTVAVAGNAHAQNLPPLNTMGLAGFHLGMSKADIRALLQRSSWQLQFPDNQYDVEDLNNDYYSTSFGFVANTPDSITCIGTNVASSKTSTCVFFDQLLLTIKSESEGVTEIHWFANNFTVDDVAELRQFATVTFDRLKAILGKPQRTDLQPNKITKAILTKVMSKPGAGSIASWEWRDRPGRLGNVMRSAHLSIFRSRDGKLILALEMETL